MRIGFRELLFLAVLIAIPVGAFQYVFRPRNAEMSQARSEIEEKQSRLRELDETSAKIQDLGEAIETGREAISIVEAKLPSVQNVDEVLRQVWKIARRHQLVIRKVEPKKRVSAQQYMELPISVELEGNFDGFYEFLSDLEQLPRLTRMKELSIKRLEQNDGSVEAKFMLSIYFQPESANHGETLAGADS